MKALRLAVAVFLLPSCKAGPEGTYILDRQATEEAFKSEAPTTTFALSLTDLTVDLKGDGTFERTIVFQGLGAKQEQRESGTWTATDGNVELKAPSGTVSCTSSETRLTCKSDPFVEPITQAKGSRVHLGLKGTVKR